MSAQMRAAITAALGRERQLALEDELAEFFRSEGLEVYEPDVEAFRERVQAAYLDSEFAKDWPEGMLEQVNAIGWSNGASNLIMLAAEHPQAFDSVILLHGAATFTHLYHRLSQAPRRSA